MLSDAIVYSALVTGGVKRNVSKTTLPYRSRLSKGPFNWSWPDTVPLISPSTPFNHELRNSVLVYRGEKFSSMLLSAMSTKPLIFNESCWLCHCIKINSFFGIVPTAGNMERSHISVLKMKVPDSDAKWYHWLFGKS